MEHAHESAVGRIAVVWGHYGTESLIVAIAGSIAVGVYPPPGLFALTAPLALVLFVIGSWLLMRRHDRHLCERCMASMPLNPAEDAARMRNRFWMAHTGSEPRFLIPYFAVIFGASLAFNTIGRIPWAIIQSSMIYLVLSHSTHRKLQPWCPWCSEGGGGSRVDTPDPIQPRDTELV